MPVAQRIAELSRVHRIALVAGLFVAVAAVCLVPGLPPVAQALALIPVVTAALLLGRSGGVLASACALVLLAALLFSGSSGPVSGERLALAGLTALALLIAGPLVGWLSESEQRYRQLLACLKADTDRRLQEQALVAAAGGALSASLDAGQVLHAIAEYFVRTTAARTGRILSYQLAPEALILEASYPEGGAAASEHLSWSVETRPIARQAFAAQTALALPAEAATGGDRDALAQFEAGALLVVPLFTQGLPLALVELFAASAEAFTPDQTRLCNALAAQAAVAVENARLYQQAAAQARTLKKRTIHLTLLDDLSRQFVALPTVPEVYELVVNAVRTTFGYPTVSILLVDERAGELVLAARSGPDVHPPFLAPAGGPSRQPLAVGLTGWVATHGETARVAEAAHDPRCDDGSGARVGAELCVPIRRGGRVVAVIDVDAERLHAFDQQDARTIEALADHVSVVLETRSLLEDLRMTNHRLEHTIAQLEEAGRLKNIFLANMSHELRTPISSIVGYTELMLSEAYGSLTPQQTDRLQRVLTAARSLLDMINDVLDLSRMMAGGVPLDRQPVALPGLIAQAAGKVEPLAQAKHLRIAVDVAAAPPLVLADEGRIAQVVASLLANALRLTTRGGISVDCRTWQGAPPEGLAPGCYVAVSVKDTGSGIAPEELRHIFEDFSQVESATARDHGGAGLGLAICRRLVEMHGGRIWAESLLEAGSTFTFVLPAAGQGLGPARSQDGTVPAEETV